MSPQAQMMLMSLNCKDHTDHVFSKTSFSFSLLRFIF